jgi:YD repeat-containing protein
VEPGGLQTGYIYDALDNLLTVNQVGNGSTDTPRTRTFSYDSLSRLIQAYNPETGWTCYGTTYGNAAPNGSNCAEGYDADNNLLYKTDANVTVTAMTYDTLIELRARSLAARAESSLRSLTAMTRHRAGLEPSRIPSVD